MSWIHIFARKAESVCSVVAGAQGCINKLLCPYQGTGQLLQRRRGSGSTIMISRKTSTCYIRSGSSASSVLLFWGWDDTAAFQEHDNVYRTHRCPNLTLVLRFRCREWCGRLKWDHSQNLDKLGEKGYGLHYKRGSGYGRTIWISL